MTERNKKIATYIIGGIIALAVVFAILSAFGLVKLPTFLRREEAKVEDTRPTAKNAFDIAFAEAQKWQPDAKMAFMNSGPVGETGRSSVWKVIFVSEKAKAKGFLVEVADYKVISASEIPYSGTGADFPVAGISPEQAIASVRQIKGYENVEVTGVEAVYGPAGKIWYWGVKTSRGVVSVKAR